MHDNVRDCLKELLDLNDSRSKIYTAEDDGTKRKETVNDLQELNTENLYDLADLLGMSDLYLEKRDDKHGNAD